METTRQFTTGTKVRVQLPNWEGPGVVVYTVELIEGNEAILREPKVPGLSGATVIHRADQLVVA